MASYKILGITDTVQTCDRCGKTHLKKTVAFDVDGDTRYFGTTCAERVLGKKAKKDAQALIDTHTRLQKAVNYINKWIGHTEKHTFEVCAAACYDFGWIRSYANRDGEMRLYWSGWDYTVYTAE